jgi:hypothetical protein
VRNGLQASFSHDPGRMQLPCIARSPCGDASAALTTPAVFLLLAVIAYLISSIASRRILDFCYSLSQHSRALARPSQQLPRVFVYFLAWR